MSTIQEAPCRRYDRAGNRCANLTSNRDGWCRQDGCPGYVHAIPHVPEGHLDRTPRGTRAHVARTRGRPLALDVDEIDEVRISQRARDAFRFHHGGTDAGAAAQLTAMLEDFLLLSARTMHANGYVTLAREGFELSLAPSLVVVTGYRTVHKERTWAQVKAGVPSRFGRRRRQRRGGVGDRREPGPPLAVADVLTQLRPDETTVSARAMNGYERLRSLKAATDTELEAALRSELAEAVAAGRPGNGTDEYLLHLVAGLTWLISRDARTVVGVRRVREAD